MKPSREDLLQAAAQRALVGCPHVKVQQCMYVSMSTLAASPVRVYVETDYCKLPRTHDKAQRAVWRAQAQAYARHAVVMAGVILKKAGFRFKSVEDYGWAQLTLTGGPEAAIAAGRKLPENSH